MCLICAREKDGRTRPTALPRCTNTFENKKTVITVYVSSSEVETCEQGRQARFLGDVDAGPRTRPRWTGPFRAPHAWFRARRARVTSHRASHAVVHPDALATPARRPRA